MVKWMHTLTFLVHLIVGVYLLNFSLNFVGIPEQVTEFDNIILFVGGVLILWGAFNYFRVLSEKNRRMRR